MNKENQIKTLLEMLNESSHVVNKYSKKVFTITKVDDQLQIIHTKNYHSGEVQNFTFESMINLLRNDQYEFINKEAYEIFVASRRAVNTLAPQNNPALDDLQKRMNTSIDFSQPLKNLNLPPLTPNQWTMISETYKTGISGLVAVVEELPQVTMKLNMMLKKFITE